MTTFMQRMSYFWTLLTNFREAGGIGKLGMLPVGVNTCSAWDPLLLLFMPASYDPTKIGTPFSPNSPLRWNMPMAVPTDAKERKQYPITTGVLDYFPDAILAVAAVSKAGNDQHNPGEPLHWAREKSADHADCITRHLLDRGKRDVDGQLHSAKLAWRALALLQLEIESEKTTDA